MPNSVIPFFLVFNQETIDVCRIGCSFIVILSSNLVFLLIFGFNTCQTQIKLEGVGHRPFNYRSGAKLVGDEGFEFSEPPSNYRTGGGLTGISLRAAVQARMVLALAEGPKIHFKMNVRAVSPHVPNYLVPDWIAFLVWLVRCPLVRLSSINVDRELSLRNAMGTAFFVRFQLCYIDALPCEIKHHM